MRKAHDLKTAVIDHVAVNYFYTREKNDRNGNPRYRVYITDPEGPAVYETIISSYCIEEAVRYYIMNQLKHEV
jgi:hypothetical protein